MQTPGAVLKQRTKELEVETDEIVSMSQLSVFNKSHSCV